MPKLAEVQQILEDLGPASTDIASVTQFGDGDWVVAYDERNLVSLEWEEASAKLVLTANLGQPMESRRLEVAEAALSFNTLWQDHGGVWIGRGGEGGELMLMYAMTGAEWGLEDLQTVIDNFSVKASLWRDYVGSADLSDAAPGAQDTTGAIRV